MVVVLFSPPWRDQLGRVDSVEPALVALSRRAAPIAAEQEVRLERVEERGLLVVAAPAAEGALGTVKRHELGLGLGLGFGLGLGLGFGLG